MIGLSAPALDLTALHGEIENRLCELGHLEPRQFPMTRRELYRGKRPCGLYFCLHGPRSVKLTAILDFDSRTVIFYGSDGTRREALTVNRRSIMAKAEPKQAA